MEDLSKVLRKHQVVQQGVAISGGCACAGCLGHGCAFAACVGGYGPRSSISEGVQSH